MYVYDDDRFAPVMVSPGGTPQEPDVIPLLNQELPCDVHLINLRTLTDPSLDYDLNLPSNQALMITQRFGYLCGGGNGTQVGDTTCNTGGDGSGGASLYYPNTQFNGVKIDSIVQTDLTGVSSSQQYNNFNSHKNLSNLHQVLGEPFEITSVILTFNKLYD